MILQTRLPRHRRGAANLRPAVVGVLIGTVVGVGGLMLVVPSLRKPTPAAPSKPVIATRPAPGNTPPAPPVLRIQVDLVQLNALLLEAADRIRGNVAAHVRIEGGGYAGVRSEEPMPAASLIKVPILAVLHDAWRSGALTRTPKDEESIRKAITVSDNPSADWLIDRLGTSQINSWLDDHGYRETRLRHKLLGARPNGPNVVTAEDMSKMMLEIATGKLVSAEASAEMRALLLAQTRRTRIPAGLPPEITVGNKTGTLRGITNDAAFVETPDGHRYAIAVLVSRGGDDASTSRAIARLSGEVYKLIAASPGAHSAGGGSPKGITGQD